MICRLLVLVSVVCFLGCRLRTGSALAQNASVAPQSITVNGQGGKTCQVFLHVPTKAGKFPLTFSVEGTGVYSTGITEELSPTSSYLVSESKSVVMTMDKPGIRFDSRLPSKYSIDDSIYNKYTQDDLVACGIEAMNWAMSNDRVDVSKGAVFLGHSEGSQVLSRIYEASLRKNLGWVKNIVLIELDGLPMSSWKDIINSQLGEEKKTAFWDAFSRKDDVILRKIGGDVAYAYFDNIFSQPTLTETFQSLASLDAKVPIEVFQGIEDKNTQMGPVAAFEKANAENRRDKKPALKFSARYYSADHHLNGTAVNDMIVIWLGYMTL